MLEIIPELLLLFIPGYIAIKISEKYGLEKKKENFDIIVYSILYSFIIGIIYSIITFRIKCFCDAVTVKCRGGLKVTGENERIPPYRT